MFGIAPTAEYRQSPEPIKTRRSIKLIPFRKNKPLGLQGLTGTHQTTTDNSIISHAAAAAFAGPWFI
jgi:hypothetical protein